MVAFLLFFANSDFFVKSTVRGNSSPALRGQDMGEELLTGPSQRDILQQSKPADVKIHFQNIQVFQKSDGLFLNTVCERKRKNESMTVRF